MKLIYDKNKDHYVDIDSKFLSIYTEDDLDFFLHIESQYEKEKKSPTFHQLIDMFPTAKSAAKRAIRERLKEIKKEIDRIYEIKDTLWEGYQKVLDIMERPEIKQSIEDEADARVKELETEKTRLSYQLRFLTKEIKKEKLEKEKKRLAKKGIEPKVKEEVEEKHEYHGVEEHLVEKAKEVPIETFLKFNRSGKAKCFLHNDKTPSLHLYRRQNKLHCFSCKFHGTVVDVVMKLQGLDFVDAVKYLNNL